MDINLSINTQFKGNFSSFFSKSLIIRSLSPVKSVCVFCISPTRDQIFIILNK